MTPGTLEMWFDFASPYSYIASERIDALADAAGVTVRYRPFLLGPIFKAQGWNETPFRIYPAKGDYMMRDVARLCGKLGIAYRTPSAWPRVSVLASRIALIGQHLEASRTQGWGKDFCHAMFRANFVDDQDIQSAEVVAAVLRGLHLDATALLEQAGGDAVKNALRAQVEEAQARGIFGAPMLMVGDEKFWGNDRLEDAIEWAARGGGPVAG